MNYNDYTKLIKKICWSWHKTTGIDFETLEAEANAAFAECQNSHDPQRGKFSTLLWHAIESRFKNLITPRQKYNGVEVNLEKMALAGNHNPERNCIFKNAVENLSAEAKMIINTVLGAPADLIEMLPCPRISKHQLQKYLRLKGWKIPTILKAFSEIGKALKTI